jgi:hypothetical protein
MESNGGAIMTKAQAYALLDAIFLDGLDGSVYRVANGEHVVRIKRGDFWLWNASDYGLYQQTDKGQAHFQRKKLDSWKTSWAESPEEALV